MLVKEFAVQINHLACDRRYCGVCSLCHMPITLSHLQLARVAAEFVVVKPDRWLCVPYILGSTDDAGVLASTTIPWDLENLTPFEALAALEQAGATCGAVDVHYTANAGEAYAAYLYWLAGVAITVVARYTILYSCITKVQILDTSKTLEAYIRTWRMHAQIPQAHAHQMSQVLQRRV